jgi:hypothetical protein
MKKHLLIFVCFVLFIGVYTSGAQDVKLPMSLKDSAEILPVKGRYGKQFNQVITFGDYSTSKIKKGWTKTSSFNSGAKSMSKSSQKFSFTQHGKNNTEAEVSCLGELSKADIEIIKNLFVVGMDFKNCFTGSIQFPVDSVDWEFIILDPDDVPDTESSKGFIRKGNEEIIELFGITELEGKKIPKLFQTLIGWEFRLNGQPIGVVSLYNKGAVVLKSDISNEHKLVIASMSTALLVRSDLSDQ